MWSRIGNVLRCFVSYALNRMGSVHMFHRPVFVSVEPAAICQLHCPECPVGMRHQQTITSQTHERFISREVWEKTLREISPYAHTVQFYFQGEPLLHPELPCMISQAHQAGLYTIVSTNAQTLTSRLAQQLIEAGLNRIIVSMDGLTQPTYSAYRIGGNVEKCKDALRYLRDAKTQLNAHTTIELQCLILRSNEHEWEELKRIYKRLGADRLVFKTAQLYDYADGHPLMVSEPKLSRYEKGIDGKYHRKKQPKGCWRVWSGCVITTTGDVLPCCFDKAHEHAFGNIRNHTLAQLFNNDRARAFRDAAMQEQPQICKECWKLNV